jgi:hypothetical protein
MPSRPLSPDRQAITQLHTRIDVAAIGVTKGETDRGAAVARLATLVPPTCVDPIDGVMARIGTRKADRKAWPPCAVVCEQATKVKAVHLGEVRMRGPEGVVVDVIRYRDKMQQDRRCYRLTRHGVFIGEYKTPEELGKVVDLARFVEDETASGSDAIAPA